MIPVGLPDFTTAQRVFAGLGLDLDAELRRRYGAGVSAEASDVVDADPSADHLALSVRVRRGQGGAARLVFRWERGRPDRLLLDSRNESRLRAALQNGFPTAGATTLAAYTFVTVSSRMLIVVTAAAIGAVIGMGAYLVLSPLLLSIAGAHERASTRLAADLLAWVPTWTRTSRAVAEVPGAAAAPVARSS